MGSRIVTNCKDLSDLWYRELRKRPWLEGRYCSKCGTAIPGHGKDGNWKNQNFYCKVCSEGDYGARLTKYGLTAKEFAEMKAACGNKCVICGRDAPQQILKNGAKRNELCIDHDHKSGKIRGLVCQACNRGIAFLEKPGWLEKAQEYLARNKQEEEDGCGVFVPKRNR